MEITDSLKIKSEYEEFFGARLEQLIHCTPHLLDKRSAIQRDECLLALVHNAHCSPIKSVYNT